jgi:hypothetical protein
MTRRRRDQWFRKRSRDEIAAEVYDQQPLLFDGDRPESQDERFSAENRAVHGARILATERRIASTHGKEVPKQTNVGQVLAVLGPAKLAPLECRRVVRQGYARLSFR